jgi:hypothetical protein
VEFLTGCLANVSGFDVFRTACCWVLRSCACRCFEKCRRSITTLVGVGATAGTGTIRASPSCVGPLCCFAVKRGACLSTSRPPTGLTGGLIVFRRAFELCLSASPRWCAIRRRASPRGQNSSLHLPRTRAPPHPPLTTLHHAPHAPHAPRTRRHPPPPSATPPTKPALCRSFAASSRPCSRSSVLSADIHHQCTDFTRAHTNPHTIATGSNWRVSLPVRARGSVSLSARR